MNGEFLYSDVFFRMLRKCVLWYTGVSLSVELYLVKKNFN